METIASANLVDSIKLSKMMDMVAKTMEKQSISHKKSATIFEENFFKNLKTIEKDYANFKELFKLKQSIGSKARKEVLKERNIQASQNDQKINNEKLQKLNKKIASEFIHRYTL